MTDSEFEAMHQEIAQCDADEQTAFLEEHDRDPSKPWNELEWKVKERFRERYLAIISKYNSSSFPQPYARRA